MEIHTVGGAKNEVARSRSTSRKMFSGTGLAVTTLTPPAMIEGPRNTSSWAQW